MESPNQPSTNQDQKISSSTMPIRQAENAESRERKHETASENHEEAGNDNSGNGGKSYAIPAYIIED